MRNSRRRHTSTRSTSSAIEKALAQEADVLASLAVAKGRVRFTHTGRRVDGPRRDRLV